MNKRVIAIAITLIFASFIVAPSILAVVDDNYDISILINSAEEEESKTKHFETPSKEIIEYDFQENSLVSLLNFHQDSYSSLFKELTSPPPEINI
jgi:CO dehydrogenase/acetyl-CoA synthase epsilon subunit